MTDVSRPTAFALALLAAGCVAGLLGSCGGRSASETPVRSVVEIEQTFQQTRALADQIEVTRSRGATISLDGVALADLVDSYHAVRTQLQQDLAGDPDPPPSGDDARAL